MFLAHHTGTESRVPTNQPHSSHHTCFKLGPKKSQTFVSDEHEFLTDLKKTPIMDIKQSHLIPQQPLKPDPVMLILPLSIQKLTCLLATRHSRISHAFLYCFQRLFVNRPLIPCPPMHYEPPGFHPIMLTMTKSKTRRLTRNLLTLEM
jgi:hypothetical protein